jgi:tRNA U55 pseudouridine synthase TruB
VTVYEFMVADIKPAGDWLDLDATIRSSSGTYIRALARDLGGALGTGGHLTALRRTSVGPYTIAQARTLDSLSQRLVVTPLAEAAAAAFPRVDLTEEDSRRLAHGARVPAPPATKPHELPVTPAPGTPAPVTPAPVTPAPGTPAPVTPAPGTPPLGIPERSGAETPLAAFAPDGTLVALVVPESGRLRSLAVFADPLPSG